MPDSRCCSEQHRCWCRQRQSLLEAPRDDKYVRKETISRRETWSPGANNDVRRSAGLSAEMQKRTVIENCTRSIKGMILFCSLNSIMPL